MEEQNEQFSGPVESYSFEVRVETNLKLVCLTQNQFMLFSLFPFRFFPAFARDCNLTNSNVSS